MGINAACFYSSPKYFTSKKKGKSSSRQTLLHCLHRGKSRYQEHFVALVNNRLTSPHKDALGPSNLTQIDKFRLSGACGNATV